MGNCCSTEQNRPGSPENQLLFEDEASNGTKFENAASCPMPTLDGHREIHKETTKGGDAHFIENFTQRLQSAIEVLILLASGYAVEGKLRFDAQRQVLRLSRGDNFKEITLSQIRRILHTPEQLKQIESKANPQDDPNCSALLMSCGNCITIRFDTVDEKEAFVSILTKQIC